jgi:hypothetical protein
VKRGEGTGSDGEIIRFTNKEIDDSMDGVYHIFDKERMSSY